MANIVLLGLNLERVKLSPTRREDVLSQVLRLERQVFPKGETMDFDYELKKRNTTLTAIAENHTSSAKDQQLSVLAYMLYSRTGSTATLHKVCVAEQARRRGIARMMLNLLKDQLGAQGCDNLQLWVDVNRPAARALYASLDFEITSHLPDYYRPGRHALRMKASTGRTV